MLKYITLMNAPSCNLADCQLLQHEEIVICNLYNNDWNKDHKRWSKRCKGQHKSKKKKSLTFFWGLSMSAERRVSKRELQNFTFPIFIRHPSSFLALFFKHILTFRCSRFDAMDQLSFYSYIKLNIPFIFYVGFWPWDAK